MKTSRDETPDTASCKTLLITGIPAIGKTTVVKKLIPLLPVRNITGFYTEEIRQNKVRQGFELVTLQGDRFLMAHVHSKSSYRVGKYGVDVEAIDTVVAKTLYNKQSSELFIIDEIGKMECFSDLFVQSVTTLMDSGKIVVATLALKGSGFISAVKKRSGIELWEVAKQNRDVLPAQIAQWVNEKIEKSTEKYK